MQETLDAAAVSRWCACGLAALRDHQREIDELNVYPVPDGDTGTNLVLTLTSADLALSGAERPPAGPGEALRLVARGALLGARGNSGVIVSQVFRGLADTLADSADVRGLALAAALRAAADGAYRAVADPVEGTILTVASAAARGAGEAASDDLAVVARAAAVAAADALARTPEQLPALARAGVVDAGGRGLQVLLDALVEVVTGVAAPTGPALAPAGVRPPLTAVREAGSEDFAYEVQYLLDADAEAVDRLREVLGGLGDSLVVVGAGDGGRSIWNVHVHVNDVGAAVEAGVEAGRPHRITVTRFADQVGSASAGAGSDSAGSGMAASAGAGSAGGRASGLGSAEGAAAGLGSAEGAPTEDRAARPQATDIQATDIQAAGPHAPGPGGSGGAAAGAGGVSGRGAPGTGVSAADAPERPAPSPRATVVVAPGEGLAALFRGEGALVVGGNPSTAEILDAVRGSGAARVVVLPNDPNTQAVASAAATEAHADGIRVRVVPTRSPVQALAALAVRDEQRRFDDDVIAMAEAAGACRFAEVCYASRDALTVAGQCREGDVLALVEGEVHIIGSDLAQTCVELVDRLLGGGGELVTLLLGAQAPPELGDHVRAYVGQHWPFVEVQTYDGGQPHYPLLVGVE